MKQTLEFGFVFIGTVFYRGTKPGKLLRTVGSIVAVQEHSVTVMARSLTAL
jgi:hypothetical protein